MVSRFLSLVFSKKITELFQKYAHNSPNALYCKFKPCFHRSGTNYLYTNSWFAILAENDCMEYVQLNITAYYSVHDQVTCIYLLCTL